MDPAARGTVTSRSGSRRDASALGGRVPWPEAHRECVRAPSTPAAVSDIPAQARVGLVGGILSKFHPDRQQPRRRRHRGGLRGLNCPASCSSSTTQWRPPRGTRRTWQWQVSATSCRRFVGAQEVRELRASRVSRAERQSLEAQRPSNDGALPGHRAPGQPGGCMVPDREMVDMIEHGCPNIIRAQPLRACPNRTFWQGHVPVKRHENEPRLAVPSCHGRHEPG